MQTLDKFDLNLKNTLYPVGIADTCNLIFLSIYSSSVEYKIKIYNYSRKP